MNTTLLTYQIIAHTADLEIIVQGTDEKNLFIRAAQAMTDLMGEGGISKWSSGVMGSPIKRPCQEKTPLHCKNSSFFAGSNSPSSTDFGFAP
ncbi:MAG: hypothetical protein JRJ57_05360, partial [Deltaproteobacteria bacterium]|nr:hypothetical protein [Deltaproteobacteria bacterium]